MTASAAEGNLSAAQEFFRSLLGGGSQGRNNGADNTDADQQNQSAQTQTAQQRDRAFQHAHVPPSVIQVRPKNR
jgi:hypothetical protein